MSAPTVVAPTVPALEPSPAFLDVRDVHKNYGAVHALRGVNFRIGPGEVVGLVGHNGAGKSTLMNVLAGTVQRSSGTFNLEAVDVTAWSPDRAQDYGLRCVFQELSLCANLDLAENTRIIHRPLRGPGWRKRAGAVILQTLDEIFPNHGVPVGVRVGDLPIGVRQMVEIARAFSVTDTSVRCVILDEPTSALGHEAAEQLLAYIRSAAERGIACILITHRLDEILAVCDRVVVMVDGQIVAERDAKRLSRAALVALMGSIEAPRERTIREDEPASRGPLVVDSPGRGAGDLSIEAALGEIIGFAGLEGHGQRERLRALYSTGRKRSAHGLAPPVAYVAGDRGSEGVFALWSVADNLTIRSVKALRRRGLISSKAERRLAQAWSDRLNVKTPSIDTPILSLSGGNQQKVLFARALASDAKVIFLDDPMRGVDVGTKQEVYQLIRSEAAKGRCFVWYTTELEELTNCERLYVFREGRAAVQLMGRQIEPSRILESSFGGGSD
ncbi:sugar ABC transporter ATP-binding protein [Methylocapsa sp. S129]|uniref:sugar ABC transporter ATP-binding protein n=1 Tax=Methylocapsa sp. S129 TaxID=1641869 RepID=UPI00131E8476|nr:sugar ABC transporter ATP-binding protein [Methylocapsa sp. S129]